MSFGGLCPPLLLDLRPQIRKNTHAKVAKVAEVFQGGKRDILSVLGVMFGLAHAKDAKGATKY